MDPIETVRALCPASGDRRPGSAANDEAVDLVAGLLEGCGWEGELPKFPVLDWEGG